ncbi:MAG: TIGR02757 family protein [Alistipes sp.]|nr:TIGR02757 family protein [Alistipes sp.]
MSDEELHAFLEELYDRYDTLDFIADDPISIPHAFERREDREISGFFAATLAWGNRPMIVRNAQRLMARMDHAPYAFTLEASFEELRQLSTFVHRTFNGTDCIDFVQGLRSICREYGSLGGFFETHYTACQDMRGVLSRFVSRFREAEHHPHCEKHLSSIDRGGAYKRLNMYLRWMVRQDQRGVDFGLWRAIPASALYLPLDLHTGNTARALGLLSRRQNDWKAVEQVTAALRRFDPEDPVRYDYALFGAGIHGVL